ncbi:uncharacterized protein BKCO1_3300061 [Diplodia corticola]|uniref:Uncharacterized protein n=1 Tax=Diplodia corticola TaxID=236234 RepID=A0A1J9RZ41_9PEZI|nr:uncharacterized protein BKCO1_3300061 [Diplodia corticola]OJD33068.1 hypothetical protein BKCO1_3300061 [Diplodia corticola]
MAPIWLSWLASSPTAQVLVREAGDPTAAPASVAAYLAAQWRNPSDILSVLLLVGPDVVKNAIAQLAGRAITPVAFSFGWVAYAPAALLSSFGDGRLMPESGSTLLVIDPNSGHSRQTKNWILDRLWRDFNDRLDDTMRDELPHIPPGDGDNEQQEPARRGNGDGQGQKRPFEGLRVTVFEFEDKPPNEHGVPALDLVWFMGILVIAVQLGIAAIPWGVNGQWDTFLVTAAGNLFAGMSGSLPQWRREKWACPKKGGQTVAITEGNGSRSVIVILGKRGVGLDLEILARGTRTVPASPFTRITNTILAVFWILLLITVAAMKQSTWYLLGIGLLGSIQNVIAASIPRSPAALGIHIKEHETIHHRRVSEVLRRVEEKYPLLGTALLDVFFPGSLRIRKEDIESIAFWRAALEARYKENKHGVRLDRLPAVVPPKSHFDLVKRSTL